MPYLSAGTEEPKDPGPVSTLLSGLQTEGCPSMSMPLPKFNHEQLVELMRDVVTRGEFASNLRDRFPIAIATTEEWEARQVFVLSMGAGDFAQRWLDAHTKEAPQKLYRLVSDGDHGEYFVEVDRPLNE